MDIVLSNRLYLWIYSANLIKVNKSRSRSCDSESRAAAVRSRLGYHGTTTAPRNAKWATGQSADRPPTCDP